MRGAHACRVALLPPSITRRQVQRLDLVGLSHLADAGGLNEVWQLEGGLLNAALALQVLPLLTPVAGHRHAVAVRLQAAWIGAQYGKSTSGVEGPHSKEQVPCCSRAAEEMSAAELLQTRGMLAAPTGATKAIRLAIVGGQKESHQQAQMACVASCWTHGCPEHYGVHAHIATSILLEDTGLHQGNGHWPEVKVLSSP